jgi:hypothetical protein
MSQFIFDHYSFDYETAEAHFTYHFDDGRSFEEVIGFEKPINGYNADALDKALFLAFALIGTSYYKSFPTNTVVFAQGNVDQWQADFLNKVYGEGLSQFAFENHLQRSDLAWFQKTSDVGGEPTAYDGDGLLVLQSGGKDSLLTAALLQESGQSFTPWYLSSSDHHPSVLDDVGQPLSVAHRQIDTKALSKAAADGGKNGHVPVTYIVQSLALVQAILFNKNKVLVSIAHEGEEPHAYINELPVTHQWSKTWEAEQLFSDYVARYIATDFKIGSPLRGLSELKVAELFIHHAWQKYGHRFSSCNRANYGQGEDNTELHWCGECPKCANSFLLFAPFLDASELTSLFGGQDLFSKPMLQETFKGLLGVDGVMKPFECIGEIDELRYAYRKAQEKGGYDRIPFDVPVADFNYEQTYPSQDWARFAADLLQ